MPLGFNNFEVFIAFNRTSMELKPTHAANLGKAIFVTFNRTSMELKLKRVGLKRPDSGFF